MAINQIYNPGHVLPYYVYNCIADYIRMFVDYDDLNTMETELNSELRHVSTWLQVNKLSG